MEHSDLGSRKLTIKVGWDTKMYLQAQLSPSTPIRKTLVLCGLNYNCYRTILWSCHYCSPPKVGMEVVTDLHSTWGRSCRHHPIGQHSYVDLSAYRYGGLDLATSRLYIRTLAAQLQVDARITLLKCTCIASLGKWFPQPGLAITNIQS